MTHQVEIQRLLAHGGKPSPALRLELDRLLNNAELSPAGIPPQAVLIVRQLKDPQPGKIADSLGVGRVNRDWERAVQANIFGFYRYAARPAQGPVTTGAPAVVFMDEGELLACLALDIRRGLARERWWWGTVLRPVSSGRAALSQNGAGAVLTVQMLRRPQVAVAAMAWLARRGLAGEALPALTPVQAGEVVQAIAAAYQLTDVQLRPGHSPGTQTSFAVVPPPWEATHIPSGLGREHTALLGLAIDLKARPEVVRTLDYQRRLNAWWQGAASGESAPLRGRGRPPGEASPPERGEPFPELPLEDHRSEDRLGTAKTSTPPDQRKGQPPEVAPADQWIRLSHKRDNVRHGRVESFDLKDAASREIDYTQATGSEEQLTYDISRQQAQPGTTSPSAKSELQAGRLPPAASSAEPIKEPPQEEGRLQDTRHTPPPPVMTGHPPQEQPEFANEQILPIGQPTELGGVLYLINMMAVLDLPGCFEAGWRLASWVGAWGTLDALARQLLIDELPRLQGDPLWAALAHLDGRRPGQPPGCRLPRSRPRRWPDFELPPDWLKDLPKLELTPLSRARLPQIHAAYPPLLAGWLGRVLPFITARLRLALRLTPQESLPHTLLLVPGKFYLTPTNLDLVASIESISLAVRMAGLDSDPGWIPEFGRFIRFHFD